MYAIIIITISKARNASNADYGFFQDSSWSSRGLGDSLKNFIVTFLYKKFPRKKNQSTWLTFVVIVITTPWWSSIRLFFFCFPLSRIWYILFIFFSYRFSLITLTCFYVYWWMICIQRLFIINNHSHFVQSRAGRF